MDSKKAILQLNELEKLGSEMRLAAEVWDAEWKTLIATLMSAQNRDESTIVAALQLFEKYNTLEKLAHANIKDVENILKSINLYKTKAKNVVHCCTLLVKQHNSTVPHDIEKLIKLPGVGRKTANVFLSEYGFDAIGVDTHLSYVSRKLDWSRNINPHKIEKDLEELFPRQYWNKINRIAVRFGKTYTSRKKKDELLEKITAIK